MLSNRLGPFHRKHRWRHRRRGYLAPNPYTEPIRVNPPCSFDWQEICGEWSWPKRCGWSRLSPGIKRIARAYNSTLTCRIWSLFRWKTDIRTKRANSERAKSVSEPPPAQVQRDMAHKVPGRSAPEFQREAHHQWVDRTEGVVAVLPHSGCRKSVLANRHMVNGWTEEVYESGSTCDSLHEFFICLSRKKQLLLQSLSLH